MPPASTNVNALSVSSRRVITAVAAVISSSAARFRMPVATMSPSSRDCCTYFASAAIDRGLSSSWYTLLISSDGLLHAEVAQQARRQARDAPASVGVSDDRAQREPADPVAAAFVAEDVAPAAGARRLAVGVAAVRDRSRSRDDHDAGRIADAGLRGRSAHR